jgi:hypothetical protein
MKESKRQRKVRKVMREFKSGTLKSGGSGKKVTNPKQAIAIALSEANAMNQGGMMQNSVMQRPMFQTPMQRESMGIMAGVAPIRGYAEGGEAEDDLSFMDYARVMPGVLKDMIVGEDDTMSDFFTTEKTAEGQGLNFRDLTDFFIVDPSDPADIAIASATAGLMASGVGAPGAIAAKLGNMGFKGKKVADKIEKVIRLGVGDTKGKTFSRGQIARMALPGEAQAAEAGEEEQQVGGIETLPQATQVSGVPTAEELEGIGMTPEKFQELDPAVRRQYLDIINDRRMIAQAGYAGLSGIAPLADLATLPARGIGQLAEEFATSRVGRALGLSDPGEEAEDFELMPFRGDAVEAIRENRPVTEEGLIKAMTDEPPSAPVPPDSLVDSENMEQFSAVTPESQLISDDETAEEPGFFKRTLEKFSDPRVQYQLARAGQATEGRVPRNFFSDMVLAGEEYDQIQAKKKDDTTALQSNLVALQELMPEASTEELINLLLGKDRSSELTSARLTLFSDIQSDPARNRIKDDSAPGGERLKTQAEIMAEADATARLALGLDPIDTATSGEEAVTMSAEELAERIS